MKPSIQLASGRFLNVVSFAPAEITIEDIAASTAKLCRFTGHCNEFYSVAQHSVLVSRIVPHRLALCGLLHDATEYIVNDVSRPVKHQHPTYVAYEKKLWPLFALRFELPLEIPVEVHWADNIALVTERRDLMSEAVDYDGEWDWANRVPRLKETIVPVEWREARDMFLARYEEITGRKTQ